MTEKLRTPKVGERVVAISLTNMKRKGMRMSGFSDPAKKLAWVHWEDGKTSGEFLSQLVCEADFKKTLLGRMDAGEERGSIEIWRISGEGIPYGTDIEAENEAEAKKIAVQKFQIPLTKWKNVSIRHAGTSTFFKRDR